MSEIQNKFITVLLFFLRCFSTNNRNINFRVSSHRNLCVKLVMSGFCLGSEVFSLSNRVIQLLQHWNQVFMLFFFIFGTVHYFSVRFQNKLIEKISMICNSFSKQFYRDSGKVVFPSLSLREDLPVLSVLISIERNLKRWIWSCFSTRFSFLKL